VKDEKGWMIEKNTSWFMIVDFEPELVIHTPYSSYIMVYKGNSNANPQTWSLRAGMQTVMQEPGIQCYALNIRPSPVFFKFKCARSHRAQSHKKKQVCIVLNARSQKNVSLVVSAFFALPNWQSEPPRSLCRRHLVYHLLPRLRL